MLVPYHALHVLPSYSTLIFFIQVFASDMLFLRMIFQLIFIKYYAFNRDGLKMMGRNWRLVPNNAISVGHLDAFEIEL